MGDVQVAAAGDVVGAIVATERHQFVAAGVAFLIIAAIGDVTVGLGHDAGVGRTIAGAFALPGRAQIVAGLNIPVAALLDVLGADLFQVLHADHVAQGLVERAAEVRLQTEGHLIEAHLHLLVGIEFVTNPCGLGELNVTDIVGVLIRVGSPVEKVLGRYYKASIPTLNDQLGSLLGQFKLGLEYLLTRKGALAMSVNQAGGFFRGTDAQPHPNLQLYFNPLSYQIPKNNKASLKPEPYSGFLLCFNPCRPTSRGRIEIASNNPREAALIDPNYLSTQKDIDEVIQGSRLMRKIMQAPALKRITVAEVLPGPVVETDQQMLQYFRENCGSIYHLCGSCAMGTDPQTSVVDKHLKVHGLEGLRIVDASVFPNVTSGNTHAAVLMVAEKGADLILQDA
ncbi:Choline dehydrogenase [Pseudomonas syringae pv. delphinii]|nr:Choline dehydrogenase [Pseudomonas syringae pv. delphinii]